MVKSYKWVRMPTEIYNNYKNVKINMEKDLAKVYGKRIPLTMPKVFHAIVNPKLNENYIQIELQKLKELAKRRRFSL